MSNTSTGGAATQHLASGGFCSAARSRGVSEVGRCTTQIRSYLSVAMPETCPSSQLFGSGLGQNGSTWNCGTVAAFWAGAAAATNAIAAPRPIVRSHALMICICFLPGGRGGIHRLRRWRGRTLGSQASAAAEGLHRLDRDHPGHRLDGAGDLRRHPETSGELDLDLG